MNSRVLIAIGASVAALLVLAAVYYTNSKTEETQPQPSNATTVRGEPGQRVNPIPNFKPQTLDSARAQAKKHLDELEAMIQQQRNQKNGAQEQGDQPPIGNGPSLDMIRETALKRFEALQNMTEEQWQERFKPRKPGERMAPLTQPVRPATTVEQAIPEDKTVIMNPPQNLKMPTPAPQQKP